MRSKIPVEWLSVLLLALTLAACYQPREGCLDVAAKNYAVDADRPCPDCCQYPAIKVDFLHKVIIGADTFNLSYNDSVYYDAAGNAFRISDIQYYFSDFRMLRSDGRTVGVEDTLEVAIPQADGSTVSEVVEDNFLLINPRNFGVRNLGTMRENEQFSGIRFSIGVPDPANLADTLGLPGGHPLEAADMYLGPGAGRIFNRIQFYRIENQSDTIRTSIEISMPENLLGIDLPADYFVDPGFSPRFILFVDYLAWFRDVDVLADSPEEISRKIIANLPASFRLAAIAVDAS